MKMVFRILLLCAVLVAIYFFWTNTTYLAGLIPWYISLVIFIFGLSLYFIGRHFLQKKYVLKKKADRIILSTPLKADISYMSGVILMFFSVITFKYFIIDNWQLKVLLLLVAIVFAGWIYIYFIQLKFAINDKIIIEKDVIHYDVPISQGQFTFKKEDIFELIFLKEFKNESKQGYEASFSEGSYKYHLSVVLKNEVADEPRKSYDIDPMIMNLDIIYFVEALEMMNFSLVRKSKYEGFQDIWMGHNLNKLLLKNED
jgi:hypothetical protein